VNSDICSVSGLHNCKAEKPKFRIEYTLTARRFSTFNLGLSFILAVFQPHLQGIPG